MAPITWQNVGSTVSGNTSGTTMAGGVKTIQNAFDPVKRLLKESQDIAGQNEIQRGLNLNLAEQDRVQNIGSLAEYNRMKSEGAFKPVMGRGRVGYQYDAGAAQKAQKDHLGVLRKAAGEEAMAAGNIAGDQANSSLAGVEAGQNKLRELGAGEDFVRSFGTDYMAKDTVNAAQYIKNREANLNEHASKIDAFKSPAAIEEHLDTLSTAPGFNHNKLRKRLTTEMVNNQAYESAEAKRVEIKRIEVERVETNKTLDAALSQLELTGKLADVSKIINTSNLDGNAKLALTGRLLPVLEERAKMDSQQTIEYKAVVDDLTQQAVIADTADQNQLNIRKTAYNSAIGFQPTTEKILEEAAFSKIHLYDLVLGDMNRTTHFLNSFFNVDVKSDKTAMHVIDTGYKRLVNGVPAKDGKAAIDGIDPKDAQKLIYTAMQNTKAANQYVGFSGEGVNKTEFNLELGKIVNKFIKQKVQYNDNIEYEKNINIDKENRKNQITRKRSSMLTAYSATNLGKPTTFEQADEEMYSNIPSINTNTADDKYRNTLKTRQETLQASTSKSEDVLLDSVSKTPSKLTTKTHYRAYAEKTAKKHGIDPALVNAVIGSESSWEANAESAVGAKGLMQLMPATATDLGVTDRNNAKQNIEGGTKYLAQLIKRYDGDIDKTLAAYNWGMGNVEHEGLTNMPRETRDFIGRVKGKMEGRSILASERENVAFPGKIIFDRVKGVLDKKHPLAK